MQSKDDENVELTGDELREVLEALHSLKDAPVLTPERREQAKDRLSDRIGKMMNPMRLGRVAHPRAFPISSRKTGSE